MSMAPTLTVAKHPWHECCVIQVVYPAAGARLSEQAFLNAPLLKNTPIISGVSRVSPRIRKNPW